MANLFGSATTGYETFDVISAGADGGPFRKVKVKLDDGLNGRSTVMHDFGQRRGRTRLSSKSYKGYNKTEDIFRCDK